MVSNCPSCKQAITHEDFLFEVECECGMHFNPFYDLNQNSDPNVAVNDESKEEGFAESRTAFEDIVKFGETMEEEPSVNTNTNTKIKTKAPPVEEEAVTPSDQGLAPINAPTNSANALMTSGSNLPGRQVTQWLNPVSAFCAIDSQKENPLEKGFMALWKQCEKSGGNALVELKWRISPDGKSCVMSGVPIRCEKSK